MIRSAALAATRHESTTDAAPPGNRALEPCKLTPSLPRSSSMAGSVWRGRGRDAADTPCLPHRKGRRVVQIEKTETGDVEGKMSFDIWYKDIWCRRVYLRAYP
jgi:hypothetical protein